MRGRSGLVGAGFDPVAGVLVLFTGVVVPVGAVPEVVDVEAVPFPELLTGVAAGVDGGSDVSGVGSGGNGFAKIPATNSFIPVSELLFRYLYHCVRLSVQTGFCAA